MISRCIVKFHQIWKGFPDRVFSFFYKKCLGNCGTNVRLRPCSSIIKGISNIYLGNDVSIPKNATIMCTNAKIVIGNKVTFGPSPTIITGDHRIDKIGEFIIDSKEKKPENDKPVIIEDDVWVGANVTILKGVTVGRGSVIAACSLVIKDIPPYSIYGGVPGKVLKLRFTFDEIVEHEKILYSANERLSDVFIRNLFTNI